MYFLLMPVLSLQNFSSGFAIRVVAGANFGWEESELNGAGVGDIDHQIPDHNRER